MQLTQFRCLFDADIFRIWTTWLKWTACGHLEHVGWIAGNGGELITTLKDEFPDLTVSKVRFLEGKGLINPGRSGSGYRSFSDEDIARTIEITARVLGG